jgi:hypothetical protein
MLSIRYIRKQDLDDKSHIFLSVVRSTIDMHSQSHRQGGMV